MTTRESKKSIFEKHIDPIILDAFDRDREIEEVYQKILNKRTKCTPIDTGDLNVIELNLIEKCNLINF